MQVGDLEKENPASILGFEGDQRFAWHHIGC